MNEIISLGIYNNPIVFNIHNEKYQINNRTIIKELTNEIQSRKLLEVFIDRAIIDCLFDEDGTIVDIKSLCSENFDSKFNDNKIRIGTIDTAFSDSVLINLDQNKYTDKILKICEVNNVMVTFACNILTKSGRFFSIQYARLCLGKINNKILFI